MLHGHTAVDTTKLLCIMDEPILYLCQVSNKILFKFTSSPCKYICMHTEISHISQKWYQKVPWYQKMLSKIVPTPRTLELLAFDEKSIFDIAASFGGIRLAQFYASGAGRCRAPHLSPAVEDDDRPQRCPLLCHPPPMDLFPAQSRDLIFLIFATGVDHNLIN